VQRLTDIERSWRPNIDDMFEPLPVEVAEQLRSWTKRTDHIVRQFLRKLSETDRTGAA
jgi:hypothetical protein